MSLLYKSMRGPMMGSKRHSQALTAYLEVGHEVAKKYEGQVVKMDDRIVDATAMQLV